MSSRRYVQSAAIPVCVAGAALCWVAGFSWLIVPFALLAAAVTAALIWGME